MIDGSILPKIAPILFYIGTLIVIGCITLVIHRVISLNLTPSILLITSIMTAASTTFFYSILWLALTILSPTENHFAPALYALIITGLAPATIIGVMAYIPNRQTKEQKNELKNNEITND